MMYRIILLVLVITFTVSSCSQDTDGKRRKRAIITVPTVMDVDTIQETVYESQEPLICPDFNFIPVQQQADSLTKYYKLARASGLQEEKLKHQQNFFCYFPDSFREMQSLFGYSEKNGPAPLYDSPFGENMITYFGNLNSIPKETYYNKYIDICVNGIWEADNIREAFGFANRLDNDTKAACYSLTARTDKEIISVFRFIFDGPHPKNEYNRVIYNKLLPKVAGQSERLGLLLSAAYNGLLAEEEEH